jgi:hypothetical protein
VRNNWIHDNADRGVKLGPDADRTRVVSNIIDNNGTGVQFSGLESVVSSANEVRNNVISSSKARWNVEDYWGDTTASIPGNNTVHDNCVWATNRDDYYNKNGGILPGAVGFEAYDNLVAKPRYVDHQAKDFRLREDSRCRAI